MAQRAEKPGRQPFRFDLHLSLHQRRLPPVGRELGRRARPVPQPVPPAVQVDVHPARRLRLHHGARPARRRTRPCALVSSATMSCHQTHGGAKRAFSQQILVGAVQARLLDGPGVHARPRLPPSHQLLGGRRGAVPVLPRHPREQPDLHGPAARVRLLPGAVLCMSGAHLRQLCGRDVRGVHDWAGELAVTESAGLSME